MGPCRASDDRGDDLGGKRAPQPPTDHIVYMKWNRNQNVCVYIIYQHVIIIIMYIKHHIYCIFDILYVLYVIHKMELKANHILGGRRGPHHQQITS